MDYEILRTYLNYCKFMTKEPTFDGLKKFSKIVVVK